MPIGRPGDGGAMLTKQSASGVQPGGWSSLPPRRMPREHIGNFQEIRLRSDQWPHRTAFGDVLSDDRLNVSKNRSHQKLTLWTPHVNRTFTRG